MDQKPNAMRIVGFSVAAVVLMAALYYVVRLAMAFFGGSGDSPGEVVGGSIFLKWKDGYAPTTCQNMFCGTSDGTKVLTLQNLGSLPPGADPANGWTIIIRDPNGDALKVCSDAGACSDKPTPPVPWDGTKYYVRTLRDHEIALDTGREKHFHDDQHCSGGKEDRKCDRAAKFAFNVGGVTYTPDVPLSCDQSDASKDRCIVFIGKRK